MTPVVGMRDRDTRQVTAMAPDTTREVLSGFIMEYVTPETMTYTDTASSYQSHENMNQSGILMVSMSGATFIRTELSRSGRCSREPTKARSTR